MTLKENCTPRASVFAADRRATVLNLDSFLKGQVDGTEFFEENYFTNGMVTLVDRPFATWQAIELVRRYSCSHKQWVAVKHTV